ncbi:Hypothetical predicted protein [Octopus vulgaris]|uniref:Uncharacterized protein n=1 Tax=Octopus vulgaris TaxID=6645 RepID=A0AA36B2M2_OCTVU|nr:Hypothetical predicted protein [Octopus vulgaris]
MPEEFKHQLYRFDVNDDYDVDDDEMNDEEDGTENADQNKADVGDDADHLISTTLLAALNVETNNKRATLSPPLNVSRFQSE